MKDSKDRINQLLDKLELLLKRQDDFSKEINNLAKELNILKVTEPEQVVEPDKPTIESNSNLNKESATSEVKLPLPLTKPEPFLQSAPPVKKPPEVKSDIEKFIGENLINKIGIAITIIGVAIGTKYSIENNLISPLTRIFLGYLFGLGLLVFGIKLKSEYENFSAVLVSGAMTILYFVSYLAYDLYNFIPLFVAFALMVTFTVFTVTAALNYNRQIIAHIGLVGAYAVPFLLSGGSEKVAVLFSYITILNIGVVALAFNKYWKQLYYNSFGVTWLIFLSWYVSKYHTNEPFGIALAFLFIFFAMFYLTFLAYKLIQKEKFAIDDVILLIINSFVFYGIGYSIFSNHKTAEQFLGLFTLCNAILHFIVSVIIYRLKLADKNLFYFISGLVLIFITITIPIQLDGSWVTLLWIGEAALLFWIGRTKNVSFYEKLSYPLMILAFISIFHDWASVYYTYDTKNFETRITPLLNVNFLTSILFIGALGFINILYLNKNYTSALNPQKGISKIISFSLPAIFLFTLFCAFHLEITNYWNQLFIDSKLTINSNDQQSTENYWNYDLKEFKTIWGINYSLLFVSILSLVNFIKLKNRRLGLVNIALILWFISDFLIFGLYALSQLRKSYLGQSLSQYYQIGFMNIGIRYISFAFVIIAFISIYQYIRRDYTPKEFKTVFDIILLTSVLWIASSELINLMDLAKSTQPYKLGLSILWGTYSLFLIAFGIWRKNKPLRIGAIILFGFTLVKLFLYDISHLDTISKTVAFVALGILLLIISFLYNKYKFLISDDKAPD